MSVSTLTSSIKTSVASTLGASYTELGYANDLAKNTFKGNDKRYAVIPKGLSEESGVTGYVTLEQDYTVILTDGFINKPLSDSVQQANVIALQDLAIAIYKKLVQTKCGSPNTCLTVRELSLSEPQFLDKENVVVITATLKVKFRNSL